MSERDNDVQEETALIARCLAGEPDAFDALVARHYRQVYSMAYRMVANAEDASDITQEAFLRAYSGLETFQQGRSFLHWIRRIAGNLCVDHFRRRGRPDLSLDERLEAGEQYAGEDPAGSPQHQVEMAEDTRRVLEAVQRLPDKQRMVLMLRHVEGMKIEEIADSLNMPVGTVKTMLFRGRRAVREMVGEL